MPANRVTRASTRAARATAANLLAPLASSPAPIPITEGANAPQTAPAGGPSPRKTRSGKILGMVRTVATKLTRVRRAPKTAPSQEVVGVAEDDIHVVPTTDAATIPQPPAPSRTRGGKAAKVETAANEAAAASSKAETAPAPAPTKRTIKRTNSTRSEPSKRKGKAREVPNEDVEAPQPTVDPVPAPVPTVPSSPRSPKSIEDIERVTADLHILNATLLSDEQIQWVEHTYESHFFEDSTLDYVNVPKAAVRVLRQWRDQAQQPPHNDGNGGPSQATAPIGARDQGKQNGHPPPPVASTSRAPAPSNPEPEPVFKPGTLKREHAVNWGYPEYYKERIRKAQEAGGSATAAELDYPKDQWPSATSSSSTAPSQAASTSRPIAATGAAPSGNGSGNTAGASGAALPPARLRRWNAVVLGYPEGYTPRNPWPASVIDPTGLIAHPDVVRDESGVLVVPPHVFSSSRVPAAAAAAPQPRAAASLSVPIVSRSPPPSSSSNESADLDEVEASITIDLEEGDAHPAADLLAPGPQPPAPSAAPPPPSPPPVTSTPAPAQSRPAPLTRQYASFFDSHGREVPPHHDDDDAVVQEVIAHVLREIEAERAARPAPSTSASASASASRVPITRTEAPAPVPTRPGGSSGMSLFAPAGNTKGKGRATAPTTSTASTSTRTNGGAAAKTNARPVGSLFGPKPDKGKKRAREPEPEPAPEPGLKLWGYASSTGPMQVRVELVPVAPSPKRQRVSEVDGDVAVAAPAAAAEAPAAPTEAPAVPTEAPAVPAEAPAIVDVLDESAAAPSEDQTSPAATQQGPAKRSREEFEEGSSRTDTDREEEGETRPVKKLRTRPQ